MEDLRRRSSPKAVAGMSRFGIQTSMALGVSIPQLRDISKKVGISHDLAQELWKTRIHEARILASMIDDPTKVSEDQMEEWAADFDSWDVVDGCCGNLFDKTEFAERKAHEWSLRKEEFVKRADFDSWDVADGCRGNLFYRTEFANRKAHEWSTRKEEFVKRAGFVLMAELAVHNKEASNKTFLDFLPIIVREASDERNFVKKAVNWGLRQIGKRNAILNSAAIQTCSKIRESDSRSAKWIASDALRELTSASVKKKLSSTKPEGSRR